MLEDLDQIKVDPEQYDTELEMALKKARKLKQKEATEALANPEKVRFWKSWMIFFVS